MNTCVDVNIRPLRRGRRAAHPGSGAAGAEEEDGEVEAPLPQKADGRLWVLAPAGKLSSAAQTYEALHHFQRLHAPMRAAMLKPPKEGMPRVRGVPPPPLAEVRGFTQQINLG